MVLEKIAVIDDDVRIFESLKNVLYDYELVPFSDGESAIKYLTGPHEIDLVLLDVYMKGMNGLEVLQKIKEHNKNIRVIMLTGRATQDIVLESLRGHADDFVEKPFDVVDLRNRVKKALKDQTRLDVSARDMNGRIQWVQRFVERNYSNASLNHVASEMCLSPQYIGRLFVKAGHGSFRRYKLKVRMECAKEWLATSPLNIDDISTKLGYKNPESFMRAFKDFYKMTPGNYRAQVLKDKKK